MRYAPPPRRRRPVTAVTTVTAVAACLALLGATAAPATAAPTPRPTPGTGARFACSPTVTYSLGGSKPVSRPLPAPASAVGGDRLAAGGLQVTDAATAPPPAPKASAWLVADAGSGAVLAACNAHVPLAPASSLKVLTALALVHRFDPSDRYTARPEDAAVDGTKVGLVPGSVYTAGDLWHALLMSSANDAATGLARLAGGTDAATAAMHATARSLGAADTTARNTSGLDERGQVSSAYDLALFGRAALADPDITRYVQTRSYAFPGPGAQVAAPGRTRFQIQNHDRLLYNYPGALGVKNGWTSTTGGSFIGAAERGGRRVVVTVLAADPQTWHMSAALLDWAFTATTATSPGVGTLVTGPGPGFGGAGATGNAAAPVPGVERATAGAPTGSDDPGLGLGEMLALGVGGAALLAAAGLGSRSRRASRAAADDGWRRRRSW
jgi:D-alanyl-D-alanine carboxypeptidase (penicillin-binding protein 5/6)